MTPEHENKYLVGWAFVGLLAIVLIVLKLLGYIDWSWWWVLSPFWVVAIIIVVLIAFFGALMRHK